MDKFIRELESGRVHLHDRWQIELKSEFFSLASRKRNRYTQEFYLFIPNSLQVNQHTFGKGDFFRDQTSYIRYKTPVFTLEELVDRSNGATPFGGIGELVNSSLKLSDLEALSHSFKMLGNIFRSALRKRVFSLYKLLSNPPEGCAPIFYRDLVALKGELFSFRERIEEENAHLFNRAFSDEIDLMVQLKYVDEFISNTIHYYLTGLLVTLRSSKRKGVFANSDDLISEILLAETKLRERLFPEKIKNREGRCEEESEYIFYRSGLLEMFMLDALRLNVNRSSPDRRVNNIVGAFAAGIAMLIYFSLFIWQSEYFLVNTQLFIAVTVFLYIVKDRMKESLRSYSFRLAFRFLSDYRTQIRSADGESILGVLKEYFSYMSPKDLSEEIQSVRNREFHNVLENIRRPERVLLYKRTIVMGQQEKRGRLEGLNVIFRFNLQRFLEKADNPFHTYYHIDPETRELRLERLPNTYHINVIIKNSFQTEGGEEKSEISKIRLVVDKNGIKRVEEVVR